MAPEMSAADILQKWMEYSDFNPDRKKFNLLSSEYALHRCNENIVKFTEYDPTGALAVMYARSCFENMLEEKRIKAIDAVRDRDLLKTEMEMWDIFHSPNVKAVEDNILNSFSQLVSQVIGTKMIGERDIDAERSALCSSINAVVEELDKCNVELFMRGGPIQRVGTFSTHIHVFERLAECLLAIEDAKDGIYLCYINNGGTADGYFGFYIKSNGSILSINERVDEAYQGQHKHSRNNRWSEEKKFELFPYAHIFSFAEHDYKGYAGKHIIDHEQLAFFQLKPEAYMPLILAMLLLTTKYDGTDVSEMPVKYIDALLTVNLAVPAPGTTTLVVPERSAIAAVNRGLSLQMTAESVMSGEIAEKLSAKDRHYKERGSFPTGLNIFVELYGDGFELDTDRLLEANRHLKRLPGPGDDEDSIPDFEFVGTEGRMEMIAYKVAREQLAEYIRDRMLEEYLAFGGRDGVQQWYDSLLADNKEHIFDLCLAKYKALQAEKDLDGHSTADMPLCYIDFTDGCKGAPSDGCWRFPFNAPHKTDRWGRPDGKYLCLFTGNLVSIFFVFRFNNWKELADVFGDEQIPKIVMGWQKDSRGYGNYLLDATDAVSFVGTVFVEREIMWNKRLWDRNRWERCINRAWKHRDTQPPETALDVSPAFGFDFAVGFSKRGFARLLKERDRQTGIRSQNLMQTEVTEHEVP